MKKKYMILILIGLFVFIPDINALVKLEDCEAVTGSALNSWLKDAFKFVQYAGIGVAIVLTVIDFIGVIAGSKEDDLKKAFDRTIKRLIAVILLLLTTVIVTWIIDLINPVVDIPNCVDKI